MAAAVAMTRLNLGDLGAHNAQLVLHRCSQPSQKAQYGHGPWGAQLSSPVLTTPSSRFLLVFNIYHLTTLRRHTL